MKKYIAIGIALMSILFTSCEVESGISNKQRTLQGKLVFDEVSKKMFQQVSLLELIAVVDHYAEAPEEKKEGISKYYLNAYDITGEEGAWILTYKNGDEHTIQLKHNQKSINTLEAKWTIEVLANKDNKQQVLVNEQHFSLECMGDKTWKLTTTKMPQINISLNGYSYNEEYARLTSTLWVKGTLPYEKANYLYNFSIEKGEGVIASEPKFSFEISEPMVYNHSDGASYHSGYGNYYTYFPNGMYPVSGKLLMKAGDDPVEAVISGKDFPGIITITYKGFTEEWDRWLYSY